MATGYIGLGNMGGALAKRLQLTRPLLVHDRSAEAVSRLVAHGATAAASLAGLAEHCDVIITCLPTSDHVRDLIFGDGGLAETAKPGTIVVDQTSGDPNATRAMAAALSRQGVDLVDAPVSGGAQGAEAGTITIMVGGNASQYARVEPLLNCISPNVFHTGEVGAGHVMKLVNNLLSGAQRLLTLEGLALAHKNGVSSEMAVDILNISGGRNGYLVNRAPQVVKGDLAAGFTLALAHKDVRLACQLGIESGVPMLFGNLTREFYQLCINEMGADEEVDTSALIIDRLARTQVVAKSSV